MKKYLIMLNPMMLKIIRTIGRKADEEGLKAFLVGGIVRDVILKKKNLDLDVVIEGDGIGLAKLLAKKFRAEFKSHPQFGTATLLLKKMRVDFSSTRKEIYPYPGSLPHVQKGSLRDDLLRRDFTINAMAIAINSGKFGELIDPFQGLKDLKMGKIRVLHNKSFLDDSTRILRAIRFEQRFHFHIKAKTLRLLKRALLTRIVFNVHPHRYFNEVRKIFKEPVPGKCLWRLKQLGGLKLIHPRLSINFSLVNSLKKNANRTLYLLILFKNLSLKNFQVVLKKFPFLKEERESLLQSRKGTEIRKKLSKRFLKPSDGYQILNPFHEGVVLYWKMTILDPQIVSRINRFLTKDRFVTLQLKGDDLQKIGFPSGEKMGEALKTVLYEKIDRGFKTKQEELNFAKRGVLL